MTVSLNSRHNRLFPWAALCTFSTLFLAVPPAWAQVPEPQGEEAEEPAPATAPPVSILPGPTVPPAEAPAPEAEYGADIAPQGEGALPADEGVVVGQLEQPDPSSIGILDGASGGFAWTLWQGSDAALVHRLLQRLPVPFQSPALQDLSHRLLLSAAAVPERRTFVDAAGEDETDLLSLRLDRLAAAGQLDAVVELLERIPSMAAGDGIERRRAEAYLLQHDTDRACQVAAASLQHSGAPFWLKLSAYCQVLDADVEGASRTLDLLAETGDSDGAYMDMISAMILGGKGQLPDGVSLRDLSPLLFSMAQSLEIALPAEILLTSDPMILRAVALAPNTDPAVRVQAMEQAAVFGALEVTKLAAAYDGIAFSEAEKAAALDQAAEGGGVNTNALLYQLAMDSTDAQSRLDYLTAAWDLARRRGQYPMMARLLLPAARAIEPSGDYVAQAGEVVRALLMGGATERAFEWYETVRQAASLQDIDATGMLLNIWPLFHLAERDTGVPYSDRILSLWWQAQITATRAERMRRGRLLFGLLEALDYEVPDRFWTEVLDDPMRVNDLAPTVAVWRSMLRAAAAGRTGETVLAALNGLGNRGLSVSSLAAISSIIGQMRVLGLSDEGNRIALETAILQGL